MGEKESLKSLNAKCKSVLLFCIIWLFCRTKNSSSSFNTECKTRCETEQVRYFANWKFGGGS